MVRIQNSLKKLEDYQKKLEQSPYYAMALILHPVRRTKWIQSNWPQERADKALWTAKNLWERHRDAPSLCSSTSYDNKSATTQRQKGRTKTKEQSAFDRIKEQKAQNARPKSQDEYDDYCNETSYEPGMPPLKWWLQDIQRKRWPRLSILAIEVLSIPAMSAEPERIFSGGRRTMSWDRSKLSIETLETLECQKNWAKKQFPQNIQAVIQIRE